MVLVQKAANGIATRAEGAFANCGSGSDGYELSYSCQGPACSSLDVNFQNIVCHKDGKSTLICSNDVKCQPGASSYQSNFTFSQNEPDPWSPVMENEPDTWVHQDQHVLIGSCAKFSLTSDGTKEGTQVDDENPIDICPNVQDLPNSPGGNAIVGATSSTGRPRAGVTTGPLIFAGASPRHTISKSFLLLTSLLMLILLLPGSQGSGIDPWLAVPRHRTYVGARTVSDKVRGFAEEFEADLAQKANNHAVSGELFAHNLVADVVKSVCHNFFQDARPSTFAPSIARDCVASIYGGARLSQPDTQFLAVFGASLLCDYIVSETYTNGRDFQPDACEGLQELMGLSRGGKTAATSVLTAPSLPNTRIASDRPLSTNGPSSDNQASISPGSQEMALYPVQDSSNMGAHPEATISSRLDTATSIANAQSAKAPLSDTTFSAGPSVTTLSTHSTPVSSPISSGNLPLSETSQSEVAVPQSSIASTEQSVPSVSMKAFYGPAMSGTMGVKSSPKTSIDVTPQNTLSAVAISPLSAQIPFETSNLATEDSADVSMQMVVSDAAPSSIGRLGSLTIVPFSRTQSAFSEPGDLMVPQESALANALSSQRRSLPDTPLTSSTIVSTILLPDTSSWEAFKVSPSTSSGSSGAPSNVLPFPPKMSSDVSNSDNRPTTSRLTSISAPRSLVLETTLLLQVTSSSNPYLDDLDLSFPDQFISGTLATKKSISNSNTAKSQNTVEMVVLSTTTSDTIISTTYSSAWLASSDPASKAMASAFLPTPVATLPVIDLLASQGTGPRLPTITAAQASALGNSASFSSVFHFASLPQFELSSLQLGSTRILRTINNELSSATISLGTTNVSLGGTYLKNPASNFSVGPPPSTDNVEVITPISTTKSSTASGVINLVSVLRNASNLSGPSGPSDSPATPTVAFSASDHIKPSSTITKGAHMLNEDTRLSKPSTSASPDAFPSADPEPGVTPGMFETSIIEMNTSKVSLDISASTSIQQGDLQSPKLLKSSESSLPVSSTFTPLNVHPAPEGSVSNSDSNPIPATVYITQISSSSKKSSSFAVSLLSTSASLVQSASSATQIRVISVIISAATTLAVYSSPVSNPGCILGSKLPDFCLGRGCVSFMADRAHCGACNQACEHVCHQGRCTCPDFTKPDINNSCINKSDIYQCVEGYVQNGFKICAAPESSTISSTFRGPTGTLGRELQTKQIASKSPSSGTVSSLSAASTETFDDDLVGCPPRLPDICHGGCFNTRSESNHCGGCDRYCSGTCIDRRCLASSTQQSVQPISTGRVIITSSSPLASSIRPLSTSAAVPVASYILKGLGGPQRA